MNRTELEELISPDFAPACDAVETDTHYLMSFDIPGVRKEDIRVAIKDNSLIISGERSDEHESHNYERIRTEKYYGHFERLMTIPTEIKVESVEATYADGVLKIVIPKLVVPKAASDSYGGYWNSLMALRRKRADA